MFKRRKKENNSKKTGHSKISLTMIVFLGWRNLKANRTRSVLTIGGVSLGIGIISFLLSAGFGVQGMIIEEVTKKHPRDVLDVNNGSLDNFVFMSDEFVEKIINIDGVENAERQLNTGIKVAHESSQTDAVLYGANKEFLDLSKLEYRKSDVEYSNNQAHAIISSQLAKLLGFDQPESIMGKIIKYNLIVTKDISSHVGEEKKEHNDNEVLIVGLMNSDSPYLYMPFFYLKESFQVDRAQTGKVLINDLEKLDHVNLDIQHLGFLTESINEVIQDINSFFNIIRVILIILGTIIISISAMGMLNTLTVSLLQRTKEVGILKALGAKRKDIFKMFIFEAIIISIVGGFLGIIAGYGMAMLVNEGLVYFASKQGVELSHFVYIPHYFIMALVFFVLFLGLITGVMPAQRASKIHALDALRYE